MSFLACSLLIIFEIMQALPPTARCCRWRGILYSSPGTAALAFFHKVKFKDLKLAFIRQAPDRSTTELPLLLFEFPAPLLAIPMLAVRPSICPKPCCFMLSVISCRFIVKRYCTTPKGFGLYELKNSSVVYIFK